MNRSEHLLTCLAEECAEVAQRVSKALRFGLDEVQPEQSCDNAERIRMEMYDLLAVYLIADRESILPPLHLDAELLIDVINRKRTKIERFMAISVEQGVLSA
jgi:NTP pyrophosphatase (non-canonical NTP hydrolase)